MSKDICQSILVAKGRFKDLAKKEVKKMPCIHLKSGVKLNIDLKNLKDKSFREFIEKMDLTEQTVSAYFPELLKKGKPKE